MDKAILDKIRDIPNFPKEGILFRDITPLLADGAAFAAVINEFKAQCEGKGITKVVAIEARGFMFGSALAFALGVGFVPVRKKGKLPYKTISADFALEYGTDTLQMHEDALSAADNVVVIDDLLATGGTAQAAGEMVGRLGAKISLYAFLCELTALNGKEKLNAPYVSLIKF
ncbi:MAG: adenine phosphoribosyltransferase [Elusimicrobiota bacterium]|jgi:adenine phosphoribosyltransferase|nr:adenine phosphoribosyltransferase [Elusimicrobiota bacterium]